jgi:thiol-disulfide isomerase/thioredoxin
MKKLLILLIILLAGCNKPNLKILIKNVDSGKVAIYTSDTSISRTWDTLNIQNGIVNYYKKIAKPTLFHIIINGYNSYNRPIDIILSSKKTELAYDSLLIFDQNTISKYYMNQPKFISDPNKNSYLFDFKKVWSIFYDSILIYSYKINNDSLRLLRKGIYKRFLIHCDSIISKTKDWDVSAFIMTFLINDNLLPLDKTQELFNLLSENVRNSFYGIYVGKEAGLTSSSEAPNFELIDIKGDTISFDRFRNKIILLHFWSSTCAPCLKEAPKLRQLKSDYKDLIIINVSLDINKSRWENEITKSGLDQMINICDLKAYEGKMVKDYWIKYIPVYYLIDKSRKIIIKGNFDQMETTLKKYAP